MKNILIVDDERSIRNTLKEILEYQGYKCHVASSGKEAIDQMAQQLMDLIFCDIKMEGLSGIDFLRQVRPINPDLQIVMISGHGDIDTAVEALKLGARDFICKPLDMNRVLNAANRILNEEQESVSDSAQPKRRTRRNSKNDNKVKTYEIIGITPEICTVKKLIDKVAPLDTRVLITGANGTGKELVAIWLHAKSNRAEGPFVEVNCAAIPSELVESELFGHEKGAFTSAIKQRKGKFEQADGGTLFLDEIGDMSLSAQSKVLRALQENKITPVGSDKDITVDVRVVAATNKNLREEIAKGNFREDLYHRLSVIEIRLPSLKERIDDVDILVPRFIEDVCQEYNIPIKEITADAMLALKKREWAGNVRELRNVIERLIILSEAKITKEDVDMFAASMSDPIKIA